MYNSELVSKYRARIDEITSPYLRLFFTDLMNSYESIADCIVNGKQLPIETYIKYNGMRNSYVKLAGEFSNIGLISNAQMRSLDELMIPFTNEFATAYQSKIPEDKQTVGGPFGLTIECKTGDLANFYVKYVTGEVTDEGAGKVNNIVNDLIAAIAGDEDITQLNYGAERINNIVKEYFSKVEAKYYKAIEKLNAPLKPSGELSSEDYA